MVDLNKTPWFIWPFAALWNLLSGILAITGRLVLAILGLVLMIVGIILTVLVITAPVGIPLVLLGGLLLARALF